MCLKVILLVMVIGELTMTSAQYPYDIARERYEIHRISQKLKERTAQGIKTLALFATFSIE